MDVSIGKAYRYRVGRRSSTALGSPGPANQLNPERGLEAPRGLGEPPYLKRRNQEPRSTGVGGSYQISTS